MKLDDVLIKLMGLLVFQQVLAVLKSNSTRLVIKRLFTGGEFPLNQWYSREFMQSLDLWKIGGLGIIALFTLITFPLGVWIGSFTLAKSYPATQLFRSLAFCVVFPINLFIMKNIVQEMTFNIQTLSGAAIIEFGYLVVAYGGWIMYAGGNT